MSTRDSAEWSRWRRDVFGDPYLVWHDGADFAALRAIAGSEPARVGEMLRIGVDIGDPLAARSIADLAAVGLAPDGSRELLEAAAILATGTFLVRVAEAMHALTGDGSWAQSIATVLAGADFWGERVDAAIALARFAATPHLADALGRAVRDPEYLVRYHAANGLLRYAGRTGDIFDHGGLFAKITARGSGAEDAWLQAAEELRAAVR